VFTESLFYQHCTLNDINIKFFLHLIDIIIARKFASYSILNAEYFKKSEIIFARAISIFAVSLKTCNRNSDASETLLFFDIDVCV